MKESLAQRRRLRRVPLCHFRWLVTGLDELNRSGDGFDSSGILEVLKEWIHFKSFSNVEKFECL